MKPTHFFRATHSAQARKFLSAMRQIVIPADLSPAQRHKVRQLLQALQTYHRWDEWIKTDYCFLSALEIQLVEGYLVCFNIRELSQTLGINTSKTSQDLNAVINKLHLWAHYYRHWQADQLLGQAGIDAAPTKRGAFLHRPLFAHGLPSRLYYSIASFGYTFKEVLASCPPEQLKQKKGIGVKSWKLLVELFRQNGCSDLLH